MFPEKYEKFRWLTMAITRGSPRLYTDYLNKMLEKGQYGFYQAEGGRRELGELRSWHLLILPELYDKLADRGN